MYAFFKQAIETKAYADLGSFLDKLREAWGRGLLSSGQLDELTAAAQGSEPKKSYELQEEVDRLWAAVRVLQRQIAQLSGEGAAEQPGIADFIQPSGAHNAYSRGDVVRYAGKLYRSTLDGNVWAPDVYPAGWEELDG